jgi:hypothetical protein
VLKITTKGGLVLLEVKVVPGSSRTRWLGEWEGRARIAVAAPPEKGKANLALLEFLAKTLGLPRRNLTLQSGHGRPLKVVGFEGASAERIRTALRTL